MARRKARIPQGKKIQPAVKTMIFSIPGIEGANTNHFISLSQCASLVNRRFYRAGLAWHVSGFTLANKANVSGEISINQIPETWVALNAWEKGFRHWNKMINQSLEETDSVKARFTDFKVYMNQTHHDKGVSSNLLPESSDGIVFTPGEWTYSQFHVPTGIGSSNYTEDFDIVWTGENFPGVSASTGNNAVSLIEGYAASRALPDIRDPNVPADAADAQGVTPENWLAAIFNENTDQTHEVLEDMMTENNKAPYPFEGDGTATDTQYPGGANQGTGLQNVALCSVTNTTVSGVNYLPGSIIPGGLLHIASSLEVAGDQTVSPGWLLVHLAPGFHRGYDAIPLQDM